jgi:hypothetical protein
LFLITEEMFRKHGGGGSGREIISKKAMMSLVKFNERDESRPPHGKTRRDWGMGKKRCCTKMDLLERVHNIIRLFE